MKRKIGALVMCGALFVAMLPSTVLADVEDDSTQTEETTESAAEGESVSTDQINIGDDDSYVVEIGSDEAGSIVVEDGAGDADYSYVGNNDQEVNAVGDIDEAEDAEEDAEEEEADEEDKVFTASSNGIIVEVTAPAGALPEDAVLSVERYASDSDKYKEAAEAIDYEVKDDNNSMAAVDISFYSDGEEVEPTEPVKVSIDVSQILPSDVDASTIEVQHLIENDYSDEVTPVVVANDSDYIEGTIDEEKATAEFEVSSFSTFTVEWNDGTGTSITVHVYNISGTSIDEELDEESYLIADNGTITISEIVNHLEQNAAYTSTYTFAYATVYYENTNNQGGFDPYTIGDEDNSVTQVSKSGTDYTVTYGGTSTTVSDPYVITIHLYYSLPTVTLSATENDDNTVGFTTESSYFTGDTSDAEYHWALSDDAYGSITPGTGGTATFTWSEDAVAGDQVSVTVTMTVGDETASDTYTLTYGTESTTITVTLNGTVQANANVALVDENGNAVVTGKTGDDGTITLDVIPGTYTVGVTYVTYDSTGGGSTTRYTNSGTITVAEDGTITGDTTVNLTTSVSSGPGGDTNGSGSGTWSADDEYYYEHIDVKVAVAEGSDADAAFSDLDRVYVYDEYGNLIYYSLDLVENDDTTDYNGLFDVNGSEGHSLVISSKDTIILVFEVYEDGEYKTYTETITPSTTYPEGEYYSYSDVNAYQLYNSMNGTNISETDWETALNNGTLQNLLGDGYDANGIDIGGKSFIQVADYLCDTRGTSGQAGLDFVIDVGLISVLYETYDLQIAKSLQGVPDSVTSVEEFEFALQELSSVSDSTDYTEAIWDTVNNALGEAASASTGELTKEADGTWSAIADFGDFLEYEAEEGTTLFYYVLSEKDSDSATAEVQYYGIKVSVEYSSSTGIATVTASYCELVETDEEGVYNRNSGWTGLTAYTGEDEDGSEYTYYSIPFVNTYNSITYPVFVYKYDSTSNDPLEGAEFILSRETDEGIEYAVAERIRFENMDFYYYTITEWTEEETKATTLLTETDGYLEITNLEAGTYTLTETKAPEGYYLLDDSIVFTVDSEGNLSVVSGPAKSDELDDGTPRITVANTEITGGFELDKTDEDGNALSGAEFILGYFWEHAEQIYNVTPDNQYDYYYGILNYDKESGAYVFDWDQYSETRDGATTLTTGEDGKLSITNLPCSDEYEAGFFLIETKAPAGYELLEDPIVFTVSDDGTVQIAVSNDHASMNEDGTVMTVEDTLETVDVEGEKTWDDDEDANGNRPESITITLLADGEEIDSLTVEPDADGNWTWSFTDLPKYNSDGDEVEYTVTETAVPGYTSEVNGYDVTNATETTEITAIKVWNDDNNRDGLETDVNVQLKANGSNVGEEVTLNDGDGWSYTWKDLPVYSGGEEIKYTVEEVTSLEEYEVTVTIVPETDEDGNETGNYLAYVINSHEGAMTQITVNKEWKDDNSEDRPTSVTVQLYADEEAYGDPVTLDDSNEWSFTWEDLYVFADGELITYTVTEAEVDGYTASIGQLIPVTGDDNNVTGYTVTVTNTRSGETEISVEKTWDGDSDNKYETRPDDITVTITGSDGNTYELTLSEDNDWSDTLSELPLYDSEGSEITYEVTEETVNGYTGTVVDNEDGTYTITNTLETVDIEGSKTWVNDSESDRPYSITIYLYADGEEVKDADGNAITTTATADDDWAWSFTDLPKYNSDGDEIEYTVLEGEVEGYIPTYDYDEDGSVTITNAIPVVMKDVSDPAYGESTDDNLHQDEADNNDTLEYKMEADHIGGAHDLVLHDFLSDQLDMTTLEIQSVTLYTGEGDEGTTLVEDTDYTVSYGDCTADCGLEGCSFEIHVFDEDVENLSADAYVIVIFDIEVKEGVEDFDGNYVDEIDNFVGLSFTAFSVRQYAEPDETETYSYGFDLYKYDADTNEPLSGVEFVLSNSDGKYAQFDDSTEGTYLLTGWVDSQDDATAIVTGSDGNAVVEGLHDGTFSIEETKAPEGYQQKTGTMTVTITVDEDDPLNPTITATNADVDGMEVQISNTPGSDEMIEIIGSKTWDDSDDADGIRPDSITIRLMADGTEVDSLTVTADDDWAWSFTDLDKYQEDGTTEIVYTITEDAVDDYDTTVNGYNVTNSHTPEEEPEPEPEPTPGPGPSTGGNGGNGGNGGGSNPKTQTGPGPVENPEPTTPSKTADADLPVMPIAGCCVAFALIAAALILRRREADE